mgnify:CR=1 FL=1
MREQIIKEITEKVMVKLAEQEIKLGSHNVELALVDDIKNASELVKKEHIIEVFE